MNELERVIANKIDSSGPITFCEFMRLALYHSELGYYSKSVRIGKAGGDFYTNADVHPLFGAVVADSVVGYLNELPTDNKRIVEYGAGNGKLAFDILNALNTDYPSVANSISYVIAEQSSLAIEYQRKKLEHFPQVKWATTEEIASEPVNGVVLSNELVDAFPVHRVRLREGRLEEEFVACEDQRLISIWRELSSLAINRYIEENEISLTPDQVIEVNLDARNWFREVAGIINDGVLITIDYGDIAKRLYSARRMNGSLRCFSSHRLNDDPFTNVGQQDITASVNFGDLIAFGKSVGFETLELTNQSEWLIKNGLIQRAERFEKLMHHKRDTVSIVECRQALKDLLVPGGISDNFKVLIQRTNIR